MWQRLGGRQGSGPQIKRLLTLFPDMGAMLHARDDWTRGAPVTAFAAPAGTRAFGKRREPFTLVVDLGADLLTLRWWRGAATLMLLCDAAGTISPVLKPLKGDCCVFCSYGTVKCPPIQQGQSCC